MAFLLKTATFVTNSQSQATQFFLNLPFGETMIEQMDGSYDNPFKFNAKELDEDTGLYYYGARYYNPRLSIWYGVDPLAVYNPVMESEFYGDGQHNGGVFYLGNLNPYIYTYQNPIKYIDPNGKQVEGYQNSGYRPGIPIIIFKKGNVYSPFPIVDFDQKKVIRGFNRITEPSRNFRIGVYVTASVLAIEGFDIVKNLTNRVLNSNDSEKRIFEPSPKHGATNNGRANKEPANPQKSLENSHQLSPNTERRIGYDPEANEFNVFDKTHPGKNVYHGHSREWNELSQDMKNVLIKNKDVNHKGKPLPPKKN
ncbi:RHS repeat-associated core domain-containing protein [Chryseobacterium sp. 3008163]|uniref:RHS repeat-associated core domain-containing protein n=1 Tax=Chryseobacterium sp. 3008163 TaxID=2478663 RepID=UPI000F0C3A18|nr:RHS repeat-associated core domain-containing protein [Chryseobacterium sp. 3008163]AYM99600.1 RHS repeat-associated core domain-containing protein [Chryseobacterium sp. 3008163]